MYMSGMCTQSVYQLTVESLKVVLGKQVVLLLNAAGVAIAIKEAAEDMQCPLLALPPLQTRPVLLLTLHCFLEEREGGLLLESLLVIRAATQSVSRKSRHAYYI